MASTARRVVLAFGVLGVGFGLLSSWPKRGDSLTEPVRAEYAASASAEEPQDAPKTASEEPGQDPPYRPYDFVLTPEQAIRTYREKTERDPKDFLTWVLLSQSYVRFARETGSFSPYEQAEAAVRKALEAKPNYLSALAQQAALHSANHRFTQALELAQKLLRDHPSEASLWILVGDAQLELGRYEEAEKAYAEHRRRDPHATLLSREARMAEIRGHSTRALELMERAYREESRGAISPAEKAWYPFRLGEMHFNAGNNKLAAGFLETAAKMNPRHAPTVAFLGRVRAAEGQIQEAIELYRKAAALEPDLLVLAELGDLYERTGQPFLAKLNFDRVEKVARGNPVYDRELALFCSDRDRNLPEALAAAERDFLVRQDVFTLDALAWAQCKNQRYVEAEATMAKALSPGIRDASFYYHAGMIQLGLGKVEKAREYLEQALSLQPGFSLVQADKARAILAKRNLSKP